MEDTDLGTAQPHGAAPATLSTVPPPTDGRTAHAEDQSHGHSHHDDDDHDHEHPLEWVEFGRIGLVAVAVLASWLSLWKSFSSFDVIALAATLIGGYPIFKEALANIIAHRMTMELSMTIALAAALRHQRCPSVGPGECRRGDGVRDRRGP